MTQYWLVVLLASTSLAISLLDSRCLYFICIHKNSKRPSMLAIWNLLLTHLLQGIFVVPFYIVKRLDLKSLRISGAVCDTFRFSYLVTNYLSCLSLLLISTDRMLAIRKPLLYRTIVTSRRIACVILLCWLYVMILCIIPFIPDPESDSICSYNPQREWTMFMLTCNTMLPFVIIILCYLTIFKSARNSRVLRESICVNSSGSRMNNRNKDSELRIAKVSSIIASAYLICWGPSFVYYFLLAVCPSCFRASYFDSEAERIITFAMKYLTFLNGIIAPAIYCYRYDEFKNILLCWKRNHVAPALE